MYKLKKEQFVNIQSFMVSELGLSGNDLLVYAIIYGFSQDGENVFMGNRSYLAAWCGCSERSVQRNINNLVSRGLIEQTFKSADCRSVYYRAITTSDKMSPVTIRDDTSDNLSWVPVTFCDDTSDNLSRVYIDNINRTKKDNIKEIDNDIVVVASQKSKFKKPSIEDVKEYVKEQGYRMDPVKFYDHYESNGWLVGRNKMKDWKAAVRNWEHRDKNGTFSKSGTPAEVPFMQNDYSTEHLKKKEEDSLKTLDDLLNDE